MDRKIEKAANPVKSTKHIPALDGLRGLAVAAVFALHYHPDPSLGPAPLRFIDRAADLGWAGVSLFFVLSGFLITGILWDTLGHQQWWRNFYVRRSLRIFPLYYGVLIVVTIFAALQGAPLKNLAKVGIDFLYLTDIPTLWGQMFGFPLQGSLVHFWSLAVEEQFYLVWPFLLLPLAKNRKAAMKVCIVIWLAALGFRIYTQSAGWSWMWAHHFLLSRGGELSSGAFLALALRGTPESSASVLRFARWFGLASLLLLLAFVFRATSLELMASPWPTYGLALFSVFFTALVASTLKPGLIQKLFEFRPLRWLGKISYGVYVYHYLLLGFFRNLTDRLFPGHSPLLTALLFAAIGLCGTLLIASLSFYTFEKFFLSLKDRFAADRPRPVVETSA
jgi:peptidoglycan/LPS O-acetylase OafA/YrhL